MDFLDRAKFLLPEFPSTPHLPFQPNTDRDDSVASEEQARVIFSAPIVSVEEKMDGSFVAWTLGDQDEVILRNRNHVLRKGFTARTEAKKQYAPLWNYAYQHADRLRAVRAAAARPRLAVCGEWLVMTHGTRYDKKRTKACPFVAFDLYDPDEGYYLDPHLARRLLLGAGFTCPDWLASLVCSYEHLAELARGPSSWSSLDPREGVYVKVGDGQRVTHRFKMRRPGFKPGLYFKE